MAIIFLSISIDLSPEVPELFELTFTVVKAEKTKGKAFTPPKPTTNKSTNKKTTAVKKKEIVNLPQRKAIITEKPEITVAKKEKIFLNEYPVRLGDKIEIRGEPDRESANEIISMFEDRAENFETNRFKMTEDRENDIEANDAGMNVSNLQKYSIDWVGGPREKLRGNLPVYPAGVNKSAVIRLRFKVFPEGTIGEILPLRKGDTALENSAINILKEWKFNTLEENAPQVMQEGNITFIY